jgi:hypothetical protein
MNGEEIERETPPQYAHVTAMDATEIGSHRDMVEKNNHLRVGGE